ncbi:hypothetical protein CANARDRAFT_28958 [[Candida] arabinofermentans NRRL YB-2248]|uniref:Peptidase M20 dimerisation domain-containing protein n=1 Tax=[Candida] arabinofermentans NRRL YB-2248 TaxID=983967 RepID=A0A1E4SZA1_9ASCO|nr:hypothetical protein CANARDRAFT_28958 [[Candida] arabinofermentans NRRL YB-2248]
MNLNMNFNWRMLIDEEGNGNNNPNVINIDIPMVKPTSTDELINENNDLFKLHKDLIEFNSISKTEIDVTEYLINYLKSFGLTIDVIPTKSGRNNIYAYLGDLKSTKVLLTSHIDTVPPYIPYSINDDKIYGRGSCDAKGSVASQITTFLEMLQNDELKQGDLSLLFVVGEEIGGDGMISSNEYFIKNEINWETVIFGEPTENKLAVGHKGIYMLNLQIEGLASHSGYPELGINANEILIRIMNDLINENWTTDELLGNTTINIGKIEAGVANNVISPIAKCSILMRISTPVDEIVNKVDDILKKYQHISLIEIEAMNDPVYLDFEIDGFETYIAAYYTDIPNLKQRGFKRYLYGPGSITVAHGDNEYVTIDSMIQSVQDYKKLVRESL